MKLAVAAAVILQLVAGCSQASLFVKPHHDPATNTERIVTPSNLMKYGEVVYWSGKRDDPQIVQLARDRAILAEGTATATR